ncbi:VTC domain-containing protein [Corallococcus sp. ZKHCc1 1396]|uniref:VTC domain-containing protein n=1 Tax=Corallococcus soli TaxID=2710757 RepID=A0ABR9PX62_9BACT|nr:MULTISPECIES: VTC domain-containing protein [Corallococcus]MBE4752517.1 VTC domain-containing protein [Corallococcus soli]MCY1034331.1 VTC domain-containing protein [Corallococcus sp. BB11-1]
MLSFAEGGVTKLRREFKVVLEGTEAAAVCTRLSQDLGGCLPPPTRIVSVYFDKPGLPLAERAVLTPDNCIKVRTKEYSPDVGAAGRERVVLEVKRERGGLTQKRRVWVPRAELGRAIRGGVSLLPLIAGGSLMPVLAVTYRRHVYQVSQAWRVTVDRGIGFHQVSPELALSPVALTVERLGLPVWEDSRVVVEVKHLGAELPEWLAALNPGGAPAYSKFAEGMARVHAFASAGVGVVGG